MCGLVANPRDHLRLLPGALNAPLGKWLARRVAAGKGCDADLAVDDEA